MLGLEASNVNGAAGHARSGNEGASLDTIANDGMRDGMERSDALDLNDRGTRAGDLRAHLVKHVGEIDNLRLTSGVVDNRGAARVNGGHDQVLRRANTREFKGDVGANYAIGRTGMHVAVGRLEVHAKRLKAKDMHVDLASSEVASAGHGDNGLAKASQERAHNGRRGTHLDDELVRRLPLIHVRGIDDERVLIQNVYLGAETLEDLTHDMDIGDVGDIRERIHARSHDGRRHELKRRVLSALDPDLTGNGMPTLNLDDVHVPPPLAFHDKMGARTRTPIGLHPLPNCNRVEPQGCQLANA